MRRAGLKDERTQVDPTTRIVPLAGHKGTPWAGNYRSKPRPGTTDGGPEGPPSKRQGVSYESGQPRLLRLSSWVAKLMIFFSLPLASRLLTPLISAFVFTP